MGKAASAASDEHEPAALACWRCGYDLRFQEPGGRCPECGMPLAQTRERLEALAHYGDPTPLRRACWALLAAVSMLIGVYIGLMYLLMGVGGPPEELIVFVMVVATIGPAVLLLLAAHWLNQRPPPTGRINQRLLGLLGWMIPSVTVVLWLAALAEYLDAGVSSEVEVGLSALLVLVGAAVMLYPSLFLAEVARRARFWPHWQWLPMLAQVVRFVLLIGALLVLLPGLFFLVADAVGWSMYERESTYSMAGGWVPPVEKPLTIGLRYAIYVGSAGYALALLPWLGLLIATLVGLRRVSRMLAFTPSPGSGGSSSAAGTATVGGTV